ncbi:MAG: leucine-rich repeat domain-containing protein [Mycoplasmoidaceae bacterium]|nr:leucine-rich repeat domain-containing protein [Mycoplasmoidaceae bacterium]
MSIFYAYGSPDYEYLSECVPDKPLISIEDYAFSYTNKSMSVDIPDSIVHIAQNAFYECPHVEFKHESSKIIDTEHFKGTRYFDEQSQETRGYLIRKDENNELGGNILYKVYGGVVPETEQYSQIGEFAYDDIQYDELTIPSKVKTFDKACFGKVEIGKLILNAGTNTDPTTLRDIAFSTDCRIGTMQIGKNIKITADSVHLGLENVNAKEIIFEQGIKNISSHALYTNHYVENVILPNSITSISPFAFYNCINLKHINIPGKASKLGVEEVENKGYVFTNAQKLSEIDLTD